MSWFGGSDSKTEQNIDQNTEQVGGGDIGGGAIIGTGGSDIVINQEVGYDEAFSFGGDAFDFAAGLADSSFEAIKSVSSESRDAQLQMAGVESEGAKIKLNNWQLIGGGVILLLILRGGFK